MKKHLLYLLLIGCCFPVFGQMGHRLIGSASGAVDDMYNVGDYSWSVGEVVVFNSNALTTVHIAQGQQSYPSFTWPGCAQVDVSSNAASLCGETKSFQQILTYATSVAEKPDAVQWYFSESNYELDTNAIDYARIAGATSLSSSSYTPYYPGYYGVCVKYNSSKCVTCSKAIKVDASVSGSTLPKISQSGAPINLLTTSVNIRKELGSPALQWYAYIATPGIEKFLMVSGATSADLRVRYDAEYMLLATYPGGCRWSAVSTVSGYNRPLFRATDILIDANSVFIPEEENTGEELSIVPNPSTSYFEVQFRHTSDVPASLQLFSQDGQLLNTMEWNEIGPDKSRATVLTPSLSSGVYVLKVVQADKMLVKKVVVTK